MHEFNIFYIHSDEICSLRSMITVKIMEAECSWTKLYTLFLLRFKVGWSHSPHYFTVWCRQVGLSQSPHYFTMSCWQVGLSQSPHYFTMSCRQVGLSQSPHYFTMSYRQVGLSQSPHYFTMSCRQVGLSQSPHYFTMSCRQVGLLQSPYYFTMSCRQRGWWGGCNHLSNPLCRAGRGGGVVGVIISVIPFVVQAEGAVGWV